MTTKDRNDVPEAGTARLQGNLVGMDDDGTCRK
jgi:hypothetical protein